jgi:O-antigen/teichoic acid export membrane protein
MKIKVSHKKAEKFGGRREKSLKNTVISLASEILVVAVSFFLPRALILNYGSETNGLISSLQQFIQYFTLLEAGLYGAAVYALYKPIANGDKEQIGSILTSINRTYKKLGYIYIVVTIAASVIYPYAVAATQYPKYIVSLLFCLIGMNGATQLLFIGKYKALLNASQNSRYISIGNSITTCIFSVILIASSYLKFPIIVSVSIATLAYIVRAVYFYVVIRKLFPHDIFNYIKEKESLKLENQREVFIQQILSLIVMNSCTLVMLLTKADMKEISVYTTYNIVLSAVLMITNAVNSGVSASFGDLIAKDDKELLKYVYYEYEVVFQIIWSVIISCLTVLFLPFIKLYASDLTDAQYVRPLLCYLFSLLGGIWIIRNQQSVVIVAAGKFKEIQKGSIIEAFLTLSLTIIGLIIMGIEGMMIGWIISAFYRAFDFMLFNNRALIKSSLKLTCKIILISILSVVVTNIIALGIQSIININSYLKWFVFACLIAGLSGLNVLILLYIFERNAFKLILIRFKDFVKGFVNK